MEEEIIRKLRKFLDEHLPIFEECHVVYSLIEIRKVIEKNPEKRYPVLRFYCNWVVHSCKDRDNIAIVEIAAKIYESIKNAAIFPNHKIFIPKDDSILEFIGMAELMKELKVFFVDFGLPDNIFNNNNWPSFRAVKTSLPITPAKLIFPDGSCCIIDT